MTDFLAMMALYYACSGEAEFGRLTQQERFACNALYQDVKRAFLDEQALERMSPQDHALGYARFKAWEHENAGLVAELKRR